MREVIFRTIVSKYGWEGVRLHNILNKNIDSII